jgi:hypothetical protein
MVQKKLFSINAKYILGCFQLLLILKIGKKSHCFSSTPPNKISKLVSFPCLYLTITIFHNFQTKNGCCLIRQVCICNLNCLTMTIRASPLQYCKHPFNGNLVGAREESASVQVHYDTCLTKNKNSSISWSF